jgi:hypothetical protein
LTTTAYEPFRAGIGVGDGEVAGGVEVGVGDETLVVGTADEEGVGRAAAG